MTLRGRLGTTAVICTQVLCPGRCCNDCRGALTIYDGHRHVELIGPEWLAIGDDSALCYRRGARDQEVIVRGTPRSPRDGVYQLVVAEACAP